MTVTAVACNVTRGGNGGSSEHQHRRARRDEARETIPQIAAGQLRSDRERDKASPD
jgi:hypothetical protein